MGCTNGSAPVTVSFKTPQGIPAPVANLTSAVQLQSAVFSWDTPPTFRGPAEALVAVVERLNETREAQVLILLPTRTTLRVDGLRPFTAVRVTLQARNSAGVLSPAVSLVAVTLPSLPQAVIGIRVLSTVPAIEAVATDEGLVRITFATVYDERLVNGRLQGVAYTWTLLNTNGSIISTVSNQTLAENIEFAAPAGLDYRLEVRAERVGEAGGGGHRKRAMRRKRKEQIRAERGGEAGGGHGKRAMRRKRERVEEEERRSKREEEK